jgi:DNA-binding XRE family transcriptional regulator
MLEKARASARLPLPAVARYIRKSAGVTQADLAADVGVHRITLDRWEQGAAVPRGRNLIRYVASLDKLREIAATQPCGAPAPGCLVTDAGPQVVCLLPAGHEPALVIEHHNGSYGVWRESLEAGATGYARSVVA